MSDSIEQDLADLGAAMRVMGYTNGTEVVTAAIGVIDKAKKAAEEAWTKNAEQREKLDRAQREIMVLEKDYEDLQRRDLGPELRRYKETAAALDDKLTEFRRHIEDLEAFRAEQNVKIMKLEADVDDMRKQRQSIEKIASWKTDAMEVLKLGIEKRIDPDDAIKLAGYLANGQVPPVGEIDSFSLRVGMESVKKIRAGKVV